MKITKRQLRRIIKEEKRRLLETGTTGMELEPAHWDITPNPEFGGAPCPHAVADAIQGSGATDADVLSWLHALTMDLTTGGTEVVEELPDYEAFGIGYVAGNRDLE